MAKGKRRPPKLVKPTTTLLALSIDELYAEHDAVMKRSSELRTVLTSGRTSRSASAFSAEHAKLMQRCRELMNAVDYKRSKTFRQKPMASKPDG